MVQRPKREFDLRLPGMPLLVGIVVVGLGFPILFLVTMPILEGRRASALAEAPSEPEGRLEMWLSHMQPRMFEALRAARFSAERPWFVTHVVRPASVDEAPEVWGIDFSELAPDVVRREGLEVIVDLAAPAPLAREVLVGDNAIGVPVFEPGEAPEARMLALGRLVPYLSRPAGGLEKDIEGASLVISVGGLRSDQVEVTPGSRSGEE